VRTSQTTQRHWCAWSFQVAAVCDLGRASKAWRFELVLCAFRIRSETNISRHIRTDNVERTWRVPKFISPSLGKSVAFLGVKSTSTSFLGMRAIRHATALYSSNRLYHDPSHFRHLSETQSSSSGYFLLHNEDPAFSLFSQPRLCSCLSRPSTYHPLDHLFFSSIIVPPITQTADTSFSNTRLRS